MSLLILRPCASAATAVVFLAPLRLIYHSLACAPAPQLSPPLRFGRPCASASVLSLLSSAAAALLPPPIRPFATTVVFLALLLSSAGAALLPPPAPQRRQRRRNQAFYLGLAVFSCPASSLSPSPLSLPLLLSRPRRSPRPCSFLALAAVHRTASSLGFAAVPCPHSSLGLAPVHYPGFFRSRRSSSLPSSCCGKSLRRCHFIYFYFHKEKRKRRNMRHASLNTRCATRILQ